MALFGKKKEEQKVTSENTDVQVAAKKHAVPKIVAGRNLAAVLIAPRITEKAALAIDNDVYTFTVQRGATKRDVRDAIEATYKVSPRKIRIVNKKPRHFTSRMRGRDMMEKGMKKAYVYLNKGDRIDLV